MEIWGKIMKGLYVIEGYSLPDFEDLTSKGLTDVIYADSYLMRNYTTCKTNINNVLSAIEGTGLNLWLDEDAFADGQGTDVNPNDSTHRTLFCNKISQVLTDYPELKGVMIEDFFWKSQWGGTGPDFNTILGTYANQIANAVHDVDSDNLFAPTTGWQASCIPNLAAVSDILIAQCYFDGVYYLTQPYTSLKQVLGQITNIPVIPILGTFTETTGHPLRPLSDILHDIANVTRAHSSDYILYAYPWVPNGLKFPPIRTHLSPKFLNRKYLTRK
jgi:hypothetical protein